MKNWKLALPLLLLVLPGPLRAVETAFWQVGSFEEFLQGTLTGVSLTKEGALLLAPATREVFNPEEALALSLATDRGGNLFIGTGHQGKVFRLDARQKASLFFTAQEPDIFALAVGPDGALYVGSSPEGKVYRVTPDGKSQVFYDPRTKYVWALAFDAQGRLYVATGDKGLIVRADSAGKGEVFFDSKQTHIMCLRFDREGNLLAGSVPNGLVYRISPQGKAFVVYQSSLPEIHDLAIDAQGHIFAAALGGTGGRGTPEIFLTPQGPAVPGAVTTVTVTASGDEARKEGPKAQTPPQGEAHTTPSFNRPAPLAPALPALQVPQGKGSLVEIFPDSSAETIWSSNSESIFGLALRNNHVLFSTDSNGRIFDLDPSRDGTRLTLLTETHESLATRLLLWDANLYIATSNIAKLVRVEAAPGHEGTYESSVKDTKFVSRWGRLSWRGEVPAGTSVEVFTRSGNSDRPDQTWSDWGGPLRDPHGEAISSPPARYLQWKAVLHASASGTPTLDEVTVPYLNQNLPPQIRSLNVSTSGERTSPTGSFSGTMSPGTTVSLTPGPPMSFGAPPVSPTPGKAPVTLSWQADDPNGDQLLYALYVKTPDEEEWHLVKDKLRQTSYTIEPNTLADGKYEARLVASDEESNPPSLARQAELLSAPFWVDNTPPEVSVLKQTPTPGGAIVQFRAADSTSPLRAAEFSTDGKEWRDASADDGIVDSREETFTVTLSRLEPGEHVVLLRAYDTAGNVGIGRAVVRVASAAPSGH